MSRARRSKRSSSSNSSGSSSDLQWWFILGGDKGIWEDREDRNQWDMGEGNAGGTQGRDGLRGGNAFPAFALHRPPPS